MESGRAFARVRSAVFARHSNPWSAWSRWATAPLLLVPVWKRSWPHAAVISAWFAVNPVLFPEPADQRAWATKAVLGEELWLVDHPRDAALAVNAAAAGAGMIALLGAWRRRPVPAAVAIGAQMLLLLGYWELMASYYETHRAADASG
ncbi:hypothetical protein OHA40_30830 [Nocardia sp. NBC_00508]|uniref:DUF6653 family protein n=1 Tax=Nocardia sp. NBC_00508 TaxID=2975992 RepID=UPI002E82054A|nr:DUF6653 family protein [Nocardia sp. NBC_00508]WUD65928.1 hypothetical protein OHA40_30830 [Nocardia sp. NBC_00508]